MRRICLTLLACLAAPLCAWAASPPAGWPNLTKPPTAADSTVIERLGWEASRDALGAALAKNYRPSLGPTPGSAGNATYSAWLREWQWCELLARDEKAEAVRFLAPHLRPGPPNEFGIPDMSVMAPGYQPPASYKAPTVEMAQKALSPRALVFAVQMLAPEGAPAPAEHKLADLLPEDMARACAADTAFLQLFFGTLAPADYTPQVLRNLADIQTAQPKKFQEYPALAIALAVVFDQKFPSQWPHHQVASGLVPKAEESTAARFAFWVKSNESKILLTDLRKLTPEQLKFVVDAPLKESELVWAQENAPHGRADFARTFSDIAYDNYRYVHSELNWTGAPYTLANIQDRGGICVDQAYFGFVCGKAVGLPTLFFDGQTQQGGHAWFGYLRDSEHWAMDCGRYASMGILTGKAYDPQTWTYITDHELAYLTEAFRQQPAYAASCNELVMADLFAMLGDKTREAKALDGAIAVCPRNIDSWEAKEAFLQTSGAAYAVLQPYYEAAIQQFGQTPDLKVAWQTTLMQLANKSGDRTRADNLQRQIVNQNEAGRADLAVAAEAAKIGTLVNDHNFYAATREFQARAPILGRTAGSNLYYRIAEPLALALYLTGDQAGAKKTLQTVRDILKPTKLSILNTDLTEMEKTVDAPLKAGAKPR